MFFKTRKENLTLRLQVIELTKKVDGLMGECGSEKDKNREKQASIQGLTQDLSKANKKLREQTEADLLVNALKALKIIPEEKEPAPNYFVEDAHLQDRMRSIAQHGQQGAMQQNMLGGRLAGFPAYDFPR